MKQILSFIAVALGALILPGLNSGCSSCQCPTRPSKVSVDAISPTDLYVAQDGSAKFKSVQAAIMSVPAGSRTNPVVIHIAPGKYKELIYIQREKRFFRLIGQSPTNTILTYDLYAGISNAEGKPIGTFKTPSTTVDADDFIAENITFENSAGPIGQALAIRVDGDRAIFRNCRFLGWQDTIFINRGRQYFENCYICGHVDFIFGGSTTWFENCEIHALRGGYLTAASTPFDVPYGYVFSHCKITGETNVQTLLGRPWRQYASTIYLNCEMSEVVRPAGWNDWGKSHETIRYAEYNSTGAGANPTNRVSWSKQLTEAEAKDITIKNVLGGADDWNPTAESPDFKEVAAPKKDDEPKISGLRSNIQYGEANGEKLLLDAHVPDGDGKFPVLIFVHGGGWMGWDKKMDIVPAFAPFATNFCWFSINYRLAPANRWPACFEDVKTAIRWAKQHAAEFKGDPNRIALIGYSAGGQLVAMAGTHPDADTKVQAVVGFAPPTDLVIDNERRGGVTPSMVALFNFSSTNITDETKVILKENSPLTYVSSDAPPFLIVQGDEDKTVPVTQSIAFQGKMKSVGATCDLISIHGGQHRINGWKILMPGWQEKVVSWLNEKLGTK